MIDVLTTHLKCTTGSNACPTVTATPDAVKAAFTKEANVFADNGIEYLDPIVNLADRKLFALQMHRAWTPVLGVSEAAASKRYLRALKRLKEILRSMGIKEAGA